MSEDLKQAIPDNSIATIQKTPKILMQNPLTTVAKVPKTIGGETAFKAADGSYHQTPEGLQQANEAHSRQTDYYKSSTLGREYPTTPEGARQMRRDEKAYYESQKIKK